MFDQYLEFCETFNNKKLFLTTRYAKSLKKILVKANIDLHPAIKTHNPERLSSCADHMYHKNGYIKSCKSFTFNLSNGKAVSWDYKKYFNCESKNVLYILTCSKEDYFYLGKKLFSLSKGYVCTSQA